MFASEEEADVGLAEVVPADDGGEGEEGQADGEQLRTEAGEGFTEGKLGHRRALFAGKVGIGQEDNQCGGGADQDGVDEDADKCRQALLNRVVHVGGSVRVRSRTHTRFVGKQAACHAETDGFAHTDTRCAA